MPKKKICECKGILCRCGKTEGIDAVLSHNAAVSALEDLGVGLDEKALAIAMQGIFQSAEWIWLPIEQREEWIKKAQALCDSAGSWLRLGKIK